jgi:hypothetical protein
MSRSRPLEVVGQIGRRLPMILGGFDPPVLVGARDGNLLFYWGFRNWPPCFGPFIWRSVSARASMTPHVTPNVSRWHSTPASCQLTFIQTDFYSRRAEYFK